MVTTAHAHINNHVTPYGQHINWCIFSAHVTAWTDRTVDADAAAGAPDVSAASVATGALPFVACEPNNTARQALTIEQPTHRCANTVTFAAALLCVSE